jgi:hypothetical protein
MARTSQARSGFALVIALSLMAFVLLLILSITGFVVVEQQSANIAKQQLNAKQNALLGLQIAIGELQQRLGPDQRATASADILDSSNNPYTLVWHSDPAKGWDSATKDWIPGGDADFALPLLSVDPAKLSTLISSDGEFNESALDNPVELMAISKPSNGTLTSLKAERRPLIDAQGATTGNYAWVAQDESLKANLKSAHGDYQNTDSDLALVETSRRLSVFPYANAAGVEIEGELPFDAIDPVADNGELNDDYFEKIQKAEDLSDLIASSILDPADESGSKAKQLAPYRNHFTLNSKGVLADTKNGGLRRDLSRGLDDQYFDKLHGIPVFGVDREGNVIADGAQEPVGDQWKFLRDYYNFYKEEDDGLAEASKNPKNTFYGLTDNKATNPSVRMRITHSDIAHGLNFMYTNSYGGGTYTNETPTYATKITPRTPTPKSNPKRDPSITDQDWYLLTPQIRPVVLNNTLKIGLYFEKITDPSNPSYSTDLDDPNYAMRFTVIPTFTLWNPFNVAIDLDPGSSPNPMAQATSIKFNQISNFDFFIQKNNEILAYPMTQIAPNIEIDPKSADIPDTMPAGAIWVLGLDKDYDKDANSNISVKLGLVGSGGVSDLNTVTNRVLDQMVVNNDDGTSSTVTVDYIFKKSDVIRLVESDQGSKGSHTHRNELVWKGMITSGSKDHVCFNTTENSDLPKPEYVEDPEYLGMVYELDKGKGYTPLVTIKFSANTTGAQSNNPAFPAFAQVNFLGATPQVVREQDALGDVKALYHRERSNATRSDFTGSNIFPPNDGNGLGYYGSSFNNDNTQIALYDLPRHPIISLADFKNLTLGWTEDTHARPIGASWPLATLSNLSDPYIRSVSPSKSGRSRGNYNRGAGCDTSYYYNDTLFDAYFFSGIPSEDHDRNQTFPYNIAFDDLYIKSLKPLANTRLNYYNSPDSEKLRDTDGFEQAAAHLLIDGPFNVNSTSTKAWQAVLSGFRNQSIVGVNTSRGKKTYSDDGIPFVDHFIPSGNVDELYTGHLRFEDDEIMTLSVNLTDEVRKRGVARSLSKFVNRDLQGSQEEQQLGRIDAAIEKSNLNSSPTTLYEDRYSQKNDPRPSARMFKDSMVKDSQAGLPGYFKQQDILRPLSPIMATRGDTFTIRSYGETIDPITGNVSGKAWCETIIQRVPEYINDVLNSPWDVPNADSANEIYGRKLKVVSFRWLKAEDV